MRVDIPRRRRGVSAVLATVILIAITLVAAVAVAGFLFGLMGTFTSGNAFSNYGVLGGDGNSTTTDSTTTTSSGGAITATATSCTAASKMKSKCTLSVLNSGLSNAKVVRHSCIVFISGIPAGSNNPTGAKTLKPGQPATITCTVSGAEPAIGTAASGFITIEGGPTVSFSGIWS